MNNIRDVFAQIGVADLVKLFDVQMAIIVFCVFFLFRGVFSSVILKIFFVITKSKEKVKDSRLYRILYNFFVFWGLYLAIRILQPGERVLSVANPCFKIVCIIFVTNVVNSFISKDSRWFRRVADYSKNELVNNFICKVLKGVVWLISVYIMLKELGYDLTGLVAGFGVGSVIISLAAQDTVKNLLSGAAIMTDNLFALGDYIAVGSYEGTVVDITFRSTRIKALDNTIVTIPNAIIASEYVVNWSRLSSRKLEFVLNLSMDTTAEKIEDIIEKLRFVLKSNKDVLPETVRVNLDGISSYSSDIKVFMYVGKTNYIDFLNVKERILCEVLRLVEVENVELAYPTQTVHVCTDEASYSLEK